jgi:hypothetical protein
MSNVKISYQHTKSTRQGILTEEHFQLGGHIPCFNGECSQKGGKFIFYLEAQAMIAQNKKQSWLSCSNASGSRNKRGKKIFCHEMLELNLLA